MPSCQNFKQKIKEFKNKTEELRGALEQYKNGENRYSNIFDKIEELNIEIENFKDEYNDRVKEMILKWIFCWNDNIYDFNFDVDEKGRVIIKSKIKINFFENRSSDVFCFPNLIKEIKDSLFLGEINVVHIDNLEKVDEMLNLNFNRTIESFNNLEELGGSLVIENNNFRTIEDFLKVFPKLKKIGRTLHMEASIYIFLLKLLDLNILF